MKGLECVAIKLYNAQLPLTSTYIFLLSGSKILRCFSKYTLIFTVYFLQFITDMSYCFL